MYFSDEFLENKVAFVCRPYGKDWWGNNYYDEIHLIEDPRAFRFNCPLTENSTAFKHSTEYLETVNFLLNYFKAKSNDIK